MSAPISRSLATMPWRSAQAERTREPMNCSTNGATPPIAAMKTGIVSVGFCWRCSLSALCARADTSVMVIGFPSTVATASSCMPLTSPPPGVPTPVMMKAIMMMPSSATATQEDKIRRKKASIE